MQFSFIDIFHVRVHVAMYPVFRQSNMYNV